MTRSTTRFLRLLGPARVEQIQKAQDEAAIRNTSAVPRFRSRRTIGLLGYLAAEQRRVSRDYLATLLWPDEGPSKGRGNLRRELHNLAKILPDCWVLDRQAVAFVPSADTSVDISMLLEFQADGNWGEASELLGGEFLEGISLGDNPEFENWLLVERERWRGRTELILTNVIERQTLRGRYSEALRHSRRLLQLAPWNEKTHRQVMRLLALTGQRGEALRQFENCKSSLWNELSVTPSKETITLYQQIYNGEVDVPIQLPAFLLEEEARHEIDPPPFVGREWELSQLDTYLNAMLAGQGGVIFITGDAGRGKTALMGAFAKRSMEVQQDLLVASGNCNAHSGLGDPYLPFRDAMAMLSGDVEAKWDAGSITREHARRLWAALPFVTQTLLDYGPHLLDILVPADALLSLVEIAEQIDTSQILKLREFVNRPESSSQNILKKRYLFQQVTNVLHKISQELPLLLMLDDIQWADAASIDLLFHLGRRLAVMGSRVLIACAYRPEEVALGRGGERHPLAQILSEFKRIFGNVWVELSQIKRAEDRKFIDTFLDNGPNLLTKEFRDALFQRTEGHPLFTVELLHAMQERGDLIEDESGNWIEARILDWEILPARVEAVIKERIDRLSPELQEILAIASVEGEVFTAQVIAEVQNVADGPLLHWLSSDLEKRHRLIREMEEVHTRRGWLSRYRFGHVLFQEYMYRQLSPGERRLLHRDIATVLEKLYVGGLDVMAVQLSHHYQEAGDYNQAFPYLSIAAERAARMHANDEAIKHYTQAIDLADKVFLDAISLAKLHRGRGLASKTLGEFEGARNDLEAALAIAHSAGEHQMEWRLLLDLGKLWASRDYIQTRDHFERALELARRMDDLAALAGSLNWMGNWYANDENPVRAVEYHLEALEIFKELEDKQGLAKTLDLLGIAHLLSANLSASVGYYDRAIALFQELDDRPRLLSSLMGRGTITSLIILLATAPAENPPDGLSDIKEAARIAKEIHSPTEEAWAHWTLGLLYTVKGQYGLALEVMHNGLQIASELGHREWEVGNRFALGILYNELLAPEDAMKHLEQALTLAEGLQSRYWIHHVIGALAGTYLLLHDLAGAENSLESVISPETQMDTMGKRYCWVRQAELALARDDPALALDITQRLITSAPGMSSGGVISFLWMLKGEALADLGRGEEALSLMQAAKENARRLGEQFQLWRIHANLGKIYHLMNNQAQSWQEYSKAQALIEALTDGITDNALKDSFLYGAISELDSA